MRTRLKMKIINPMELDGARFNIFIVLKHANELQSKHQGSLSLPSVVAELHETQYADKLNAKVFSSFFDVLKTTLIRVETLRIKQTKAIRCSFGQI